MPGVKSAIFTRRLVVFHQTFAPLGPRSKAKPIVGVIWHEAIADRNAEDVASAFVECFGNEPYRDAKQFVFWCDNCSGQNKNWTLYTALCFIVNKTGGPEHVTLRYLERGHTFVSADSFHASIEKSMKQKGNIHDFTDFIEYIVRNGHVMEIQPTDFTDWPKGSISAKFTHKPILKDVCEVQFRHGSTKMYRKTSFDAPSYSERELLKIDIAKRVLKGTLPNSRVVPRGITTSKKSDIVTKLCPLMPVNRQQFWTSLPESATASDLLTCFD